MKNLSREELCEALAEDYADRAAKGGNDYTKSYVHYLERCLLRKTTDLLQQYKVQGLHNLGFIF